VTMLGFAAAMGATHMATLPPTSQLIAEQHGVARMGTLMGIVMLVHQVGGFAGVWLGGWAAQATGSDHLLWMVDIALALFAAALVWRRRARRPLPCAPNDTGPKQVLAARLSDVSIPLRCASATGR
jgi:predicted MFS family arabinose efflux permease